MSSGGEPPREPATSQTEAPSSDSKQGEGPIRKPYVKPRVEETEPLEGLTLLSGGVNPSTANPFFR
jgi:hypothetical protein